MAQIRLPCADAVEIAYYLSLPSVLIRMARTNTERDKVWMRRRARVPPLLGSGSAGAGYVRLTGYFEVVGMGVSAKRIGVWIEASGFFFLETLRCGVLI